MRVCRQCGRPGAVRVGGVLRPRLACPVCGAVFRSSRGAEEPAPAPRDPLTDFVPAPMARWLREEHPGEPLEPPSDRAGITAWYTAYDRFLWAAASSPAARARLVTLGGEPAGPPVDFAKVLLTLQAACYDTALTARRMDAGPETAERVEHARRWLAGPGRAAAWLDGPPAEPDPALARELLRPGALTGSFDRARATTLLAALFGVERGPQVRSLVGQFGEERLREALAAHLRDGSRPLRAVVLDLLEGR